jgi:REP element-mobilizing transposase RayT
VHSSNQGGMTDKHAPLFIQSTDKDGLDSSKDILLEPVQPGSYDLSYTCFLIPRIPSQQLIGDLADNLPQWLKEICTSFDWKLEFVAVNPDYFQWALWVLPTVPTGRIIQQVRSKTSELIFANFGQLKKENLSDDFWATGYLIISGIHPNAKEVVERYIRITR